MILDIWGFRERNKQPNLGTRRLALMRLDPLMEIFLGVWKGNAGGGGR